MATVVRKSNPKDFRISANTSDYPAVDWLINPASFSLLHGPVPPRYWKLNVAGDDIEEMTQPEKDAVDAAESAALITSVHAGLTGEVDATFPGGVGIRSLIQLLNKRDNYLVNRISELQAAMDAMKASTGAIQNLRDAIPASWLATSSRTLPDAIQDYKDDISAGVAD